MDDDVDAIDAFGVWDRLGTGDGANDEENDDETSILPGPFDCGVEASNNRIYGGDFTSLTEYPW